MVLHGDGPPYVQVGNKKLFRREAVLQWLREREAPARPQSLRGRLGQPRGGRNGGQ
jgi:hypothetical protein